MKYQLLGLLILMACDRDMSNDRARQMNTESEVIVQLTGTANPPPALRIPKSYLTGEPLADMESGVVSAISVQLLIPNSFGFNSSADYEFIEGYRPMRLTHVAPGIAHRRRESIDLAVARNGSDSDQRTGLQRVMIEELPSREHRYRYFNDSKEDEKYVHLDCIFFEKSARYDTCFMEIVAAKGIAVSSHFKAGGLHEWRAREDDMRKLVNSWLDHETIKALEGER